MSRHIFHLAGWERDQKKTNKDQKKQIGIKKKQNPENMRKHKETITK
jgi:hypothetical protein